jgi:hypothetical protein
MLLHNNYFYYKNALTPEQCQRILDKGKSVLPMDAKTLDQKEKGMHKDYTRDSTIAWLSDTWIYEMILPFVKQANEEAGWRYEWDHVELCQFTKYGLNQFYGWHPDGYSDWPGIYKPVQKDDKGIWKLCDVVMNEDQSDWVWEFDEETKQRYPKVAMTENDCPLQRKKDPKDPDEPISSFVPNKFWWGKVRKLSITLNLSVPEDYVGGNLKFDFGPLAGDKRYHTCEEIRPQGSIIVFPSYQYHTVTPVTSGTRYSLVTWILGKPFR